MILYSYNEYCPVVKRNELLIYTACMNLHTIIQSERSRGGGKIAFYTIPFIENSRKYKLIQSDRKQVSCCLRDQGRVRGSGGRKYKGNK